MTCGLQHKEATQRGRIRVAGRAGERGSNLVEQSFIIIVLLMLLFGIFDFGRALYTYHFVSNVAREASRWASVRGSTCNAGALSGCPATSGSSGNIQTTFSANMSNMGLDPNKITFTTTWVAPPNASVTNCTPQNNPGCVVSVNVQYTYKVLFPLLPVSMFTMSSQSQMVITQ